LAQLIKSSDIKVVTKEGECKLSITIDLNLNLNSSGIQVGANVVEKSGEVAKKEEKTAWEIPDFTTMPKLNFGKKA
jgi:hypothetical protein